VEKTPTFSVEPVNLGCDFKMWVLRSSGRKIENYVHYGNIDSFFQFCMHIMEFAVVEVLYVETLGGPQI
jgi:hypothetical protein